MKSKEKNQDEVYKETKPRKVLKWILEIIFIILLIPVAVISYKSADPFRGNEKVPEVLRDYATSDFKGIQPYIVVSNSMQGTADDDFDAGDLVICELVTADEIEVGDVVSYTIGDPLDRYIVIHRVIAENEDGTFIFKGDANNTQDMSAVYASQIQARYIFKIPKVGYVVEWIGEHRIQLVLGIVAVYCIFTVVETLREKDDDEDEEETDEEVTEVTNESDKNVTCDKEETKPNLADELYDLEDLPDESNDNPVEENPVYEDLFDLPDPKDLSSNIKITFKKENKDE